MKTPVLPVGLTGQVMGRSGTYWALCVCVCVCGGLGDRRVMEIDVFAKYLFQAQGLPSPGQ